VVIWIVSIRGSLTGKASQAKDARETGIGLKQAALASSAVAVAILTNLVVCQFFIFAAETGHIGPAMYNRSDVCRRTPSAHERSKLLLTRGSHRPQNQPVALNISLRQFARDVVEIGFECRLTRARSSHTGGPPQL
jgi:hypothetical protein